LIYHVDDERIGRVKLDRPEDRWVDGMRNFARLMKTTSQDSTLESVKVALVDDGIDVSRRTTNIAGGFSFSTSNEPHSLARPWYFSEDGHGTKMADLICAPVPSVKLYVAKVDTKDWWNGVAKVSRLALNTSFFII
jgi:subtilisin family serine protease